MAALQVLLLLAVQALVLLASPAQADARFQAASGAHKVAVLELYTSEGCSSCPPADSFVSRLAAAGYYPERVIPLAFHVTYWDSLGWRDPFARSAFDQRQYRVAQRQGRSGVYTPQLILDGANLRGTGGFGKRLRAANAAIPAAQITVDGRAAAAQLELDIAVQVIEAARRPAARLYVALLESGLGSSVKAGENRGRELQHDHVVRQLLGPLALPVERADSRHMLALTLPAQADPERSALAVFVQDRDSGETLQALAVPLAEALSGSR